MRDTTSRYRMRSANPLPKFGSSKNPFAAPVKAEPVSPAPVKAAPVAPAPAPKTEPAAMVTVSLFDPKPAAVVAPVVTPVAEVVEAEQPELKPVSAVKSEAKPASAARSVVEKPAALGAWLRKLNPLSYLSDRKPGARSAARSKPARAAVQGELSLEKVKVVRNDLSDVDFEVVQVRRPRVADVAAPAVEQEAKSGPTTWNRLTSRLAGAGHHQAH
jgi:hypothetical protein